jgi:hypothetical protein
VLDQIPRIVEKLMSGAGQGEKVRFVFINAKTKTSRELVRFLGFGA